MAFYCLIYGEADLLDPGLAGWRRVLAPGGLVLAAVHAGEGRVHVDDWMGRGVAVTVVLRDPDDLVARFERAGFTVTDRHVRAALFRRAPDGPVLPGGGGILLGHEPTITVAGRCPH